MGLSRNLFEIPMRPSMVRTRDCSVHGAIVFPVKLLWDIPGFMEFTWWPHGTPVGILWDWYARIHGYVRRSPWL